MKINEKDWLEDFQEFAKSGGSRPPEAVSQEVLARVRADLEPAPQIVFAKLFGIHAVVGTASLAICNQFDMNPFRTSFSLSNYFMKFGHSTCMALCGFLFVGLTVGACGLFFRPEEIRVVRDHALVQSLGLAGLSLGVFAAFGAEIAISIGLLWLVGALLGGFTASRVLGGVRSG